MKLTELAPVFIRYEVRAEPDREHKYLVPVDSLGEAHGIRFLCPKCFHENGGPVGTHSVICWFEGRVSDDVDPKPGRWNPTGSGYGDLSFVPGAKSNSVLLLGGCAWHGFITNGEAVGGY
jgi:hypothetical protein